MKRTLFSLLALLFLWPVSLRAADGPEEFLSRLLDTDFAGDCVPRHDNVLYTDGKGDSVGDCGCAEPRSNFYPEYDPLIIITRWRVVGTRMETPAKALITVRYRLIASAEGRNEDRKIVPLSEPRDEDVTYRVWRRKGQWRWVDPPSIVRVGYEGVRTAVAKAVGHLAELLEERPDRDDWRQILGLYRAELAALVVLEPLAAANR